MAKCHPIKTQQQRDAFTSSLEAHGDLFADLWSLGSLTAFRISDLLSLRSTDNWELNFSRGFFISKDQKTSKSNHTKITPRIQDILQRRLQAANDADSTYLFASTSKVVQKDAPMSDRHIRRVFGAAARQNAIPGNIGTHSMRKTAGYVMYSNNVPVERIQKRLNHSSPAETKEYIGIEQEQLDGDLENLESWL